VKKEIFLNVEIHVGNELMLVGELAHIGHRIYFEYSPEFIASGIELSPFNLPLKPGVQEDDHRVFHGLHGLFSDSLPDGWGLLLMDRFFRKEGIDPFSISPLERLAYIGNRGMGALTYKPAKKIDSNLQGLLDLSVLARECEEVLRGDEKDILPELIIAGGSPGGARPKVLIGFNEKTNEVCSGTVELPEGFEPYLVKFSAMTDFKDLGAIEYAYALMAKDAGIFMSDSKIFDAGNEGRFFGVKRFDRKNNQRIHMHTLSGLLHADYRTPNLDYIDFLKTVLALTKNHQEVLQAFRLMVFNLLTHNRDDHSKNFSFLLLDDAWHLSPAYDLTFSSGIAGEHTMMIGGEGANPKKDHLLLVAKKLGIKSKVALEIIDELRSVVSKWSSYAKNVGVTDCSTKQLQRALENISIN